MDPRLLGNNVDVVGLEKGQDEEQESPRKSQRQRRPKRHFVGRNRLLQLSAFVL